MAPEGGSTEWFEPLWPSRCDLLDLTGIILRSGTICQSSNMIDCLPPLGRGGGGLWPPGTFYEIHTYKT